MGLLKTSWQKYQHATIFIFVQVKTLQSSREIIPGNKHSHTVWLTFELQWFPWFHRQNHICCRSQLPYWWGRDPSRDPVSTEAATNCRQSKQHVTFTQTNQRHYMDQYSHITGEKLLPLVDICCSIVWFQFNTLVVHFIGFSKLLLISQSLRSTQEDW